MNKYFSEKNLLEMDPKSNQQDIKEGLAIKTQRSTIGKGSELRERQVSAKQYEENWERTFGIAVEQSPLPEVDEAAAYGHAADYWTDDYARGKAERLGCTVEFADDYTLQLDIDSDEAFEFFLKQMTVLLDLRIVGLSNPVIRTSRNGNRHVMLFLATPLPVRERLLLQACLGSDRKRDLLSYAGVLKGQEHPILLFRPKN